MLSLQPAALLDDMLVHVRDFHTARNAYPVQVTLEGGRHFDGWLTLEGLPTAPTGSNQAIVTYGINLFNRLFAVPLDDAFQQAMAAARARKRKLRLRLWLDSSAPTLHDIPWELLHYDASGGMARPMPLATDDRIAFSRYLSSSEPWKDPPASRPLQTLVIISAPHDLGTAAWPDLIHLDKASERRELEAQLEPMQQAGQLHLTMLDTASPENLHAELDTDYDIVLYFGHALHHPQRGTRLVLEDHETGQALLYDSDELVGRLQQSDPRPSLLILIACNTAAQQARAASSQHAVQFSAPTSLAARLVQVSGIPAVLAMQHLIDLTVARVFSHHLSDYLRRHGIVDIAVNAVRQRVFSTTSLDWSTPVLYMRSQDGRLFAPNARLEYVQAIVDNPDFARWQTSEFIRIESIIVPQGQPWHLFLSRPEDAPPGIDTLEALQRELHLETIIPPTNLIALLGPPRSGQTTVLQRFAHDLAQAARQQPIAETLVPVFVPLAGYDEQRGTNRLEQIILDTVAQTVPTLSRLLQTMFRQRRIASLNTGDDEPESEEAPAGPGYVFLLDGLDGVPEPERQQAAEELIALAARHPTRRFIVSSTQEAFPVAIFPQIITVLMQPLNERLVLRYLRQRAPERSGYLFRAILENRLIDMTTDPAMLVFVFERLAYGQARIITRNQLLHDLLNEALSRLPTSYTQGDVARRTITTLAWEFLWQHTTTRTLNDVFADMNAVRQDRDYSLEALFRLFVKNRLLVEVGQDRVRFVYPVLQAYCAALALRERPDFQARLNDIIAMCGISPRMRWWEDTLYALAGALDDPAPLGALADAAIQDKNSTHTLLVARCLRALSDNAERLIDEANRLAFIDVCVARLHTQVEPLVERRAQIVTALSRLRHPKVFEELNRLLTGRLRQFGDGLRYEHPTVRFAAARALRTLVARIPPDIIRQSADAETLRRLDALTNAVPPQMQQQLHQQMQQVSRNTSTRADTPAWYSTCLEALDMHLIPIFLAWTHGIDGRAEVQQSGLQALRHALTNSNLSPLERGIAAFALGDLAIHTDDAGRLLEFIMQPPPDEHDAIEWNDALWAAADALTLFDSEHVTRLIGQVFEQGTAPDPIPAYCVNQVAYITGRVRVENPDIWRWLLLLLRDDPRFLVKATALQSLAWIGMVQPSLEWLNNMLPTLNLPYSSEDGDTTHDTEETADIVLLVIEDIAAWNRVQLTRMGFFAAPAPPDPWDQSHSAHLAPAETSTPGDGNIWSENSFAVLHLRSTAIQALGLIGNQRTLQRMNAVVASWPVALRGAWHFSSHDIAQRLRQQPEPPPAVRRSRKALTV